MKFIGPFLLLLLIYFEPSLHSEPWLANRFVKNCASCHAPARFNRPMKERGCTVSCQGCHVNPNGGGMRNFYGKWNSQKWLKSNNVKFLEDKGKPLPWFAQNYIPKDQLEKVVRMIQGSGDERLPKKVTPKDEKQLKITAAAIKKLKKLQNSKIKRTIYEGDLKNLRFPEEYYLVTNSDISMYIEVDKKTFESRIPKDDPYFQTLRNPFTLGLDFRYQVLSEITKKPSGSKETYYWPMAFDVGVQIRPFPAHGTLGKFSFVSETRYFNSPLNKDLESIFTNGARVRSAYFMVDKLPYNTFFMHGIYKPLFEHYSPDHTSLSQRILYGQPYYVTFRTTSVGLAPNVPFVNVHYIQPMLNQAYSQEKGIVANTGLRFVSYGASVVYSYWSTENEITATQTDAHSLHGGMSIGPWTGNAEMLIVERNTSLVKNRGTVFTLENRVKLIDELYAELIYEKANTSVSLTQGSAQRLYLGGRYFAISGVDLSLGVSRAENSEPLAGKTESLDVMGQIHLYY